MTDTVTISRECAEYLHGALGYYESNFLVGEEEYSQFRKINDELLTALSSPPPPSELMRSALRAQMADAVTISREYAERIMDLMESERWPPHYWAELTAALAASPDGGWVKVNESHPLPSDLGPDDMLRIEARRGDSRGAAGVVAYRRRPAEQGG